MPCNFHDYVDYKRLGIKNKQHLSTMPSSVCTWSLCCGSGIFRRAYPFNSIFLPHGQSVSVRCTPQNQYKIGCSCHSVSIVFLSSALAPLTGVHYVFWLMGHHIQQPNHGKHQFECASHFFFSCENFSQSDPLNHTNYKFCCRQGIDPCHVFVVQLPQAKRAPPQSCTMERSSVDRLSSMYILCCDFGWVGARWILGGDAGCFDGLLCVWWVLLTLTLGYHSTCQFPLWSLENGMSNRGTTSITYSSMLLNQIIATRPRRESKLHGIWLKSYYL